MKPHVSFYGTTCWFCGHPRTGERHRTVAKCKYGACSDCERFKAAGTTVEEIKAEIHAARTADLNAIVIAIEKRQAGSAKYWIPADFRAMLTIGLQHGTGFTRALMPKDYADKYAAATQEHMQGKMQEYKRNWNKEHKHD